MRTGILANSLPAAVRIYNQVKAVPDCECFILLSPSGKESRLGSLLGHFARLALRPERLNSLSLILGGKVLVLDPPLDHPQTIERLTRLKLDIGLHRTGVIYRAATINAFRLGILNPHIGLLPEYRGRNVMEWTLLEGNKVGITVFFVDDGIDTGERIVLREEVDISHCRSLEEAKEYLFSLDGTFFRRALESLRSQGSVSQINDGSGRRYYVMSKLFRDVVQELIVANK